MAKTRHVRGVLRSVSSQRTQYKPYGYDLCFDGWGAVPAVIVELEIPEDTVLQVVTGDDDKFGESYIVVNLDGLNAILEVTADSIDKLDQKYKKKVQNGGK